MQNLPRTCQGMLNALDIFRQIERNRMRKRQVEMIWFAKLPLISFQHREFGACQVSPRKEHLIFEMKRNFKYWQVPQNLKESQSEKTDSPHLWLIRRGSGG